LKSLNLTNAQARVYLAALELGQASMMGLAKKSGVNRATIYHFIEDLKERHFIIETKRSKRSVYSATDPSFLIELERARMGQLETFLPELKAIYNKREKKPRVQFFEGVEGIKKVYSDTLSEKKSMYVFGDFEYSPKVMGESYIEGFVSERVKRNIEYNAILRDSATARQWAKRNMKDLREIRFVNEGNFATEIDIYGDRVALMSFRKDRPMAVLIEDKDIAETLMTVWKNLWDKLEHEG
jgi:HTH-type transcriptional regulator, sugar sensing transcriptional regulator